MVTAELAVTFPALALVLVLCLYAIVVTSAQLRCVDAAAVAARLAARAEPAGVVAAQAALTGPPSATLQIRRGGGLVSAEVTDVVRLPLLGRLLPGMTVHAEVTAADEQPSGPTAGER
jgi:hypothetical protein